MLKALISILLLSGSAGYAADKKAPAVKTVTIEDESLRSSHKARLAEISAIEKSAVPAAAALKPLLADKNPLVRGEAAEAMGRSKDPAALVELSADIKSEDDHIRWGAIKGLGSLGDKRAVPVLIPALSHTDRNTRWKAAQALGELKDSRAVDQLISAARGDKDKNVRLAAIEALMSIGGGKALAALDGLSGDPDRQVKAWAAAAAAKLKQK